MHSFAIKSTHNDWGCLRSRVSAYRYARDAGYTEIRGSLRDAIGTAPAGRPHLPALPSARTRFQYQPAPPHNWKYGRKGL